MEHPLDLSGREEERHDFPSRDEPICQVVNCSCPLKHIMQLDGPSSISKNVEMPMPKIRVPEAVDYQRFRPFSGEESYKRQYDSSECAQTQHKKVKTETSENDLYAVHYGNSVHAGSPDQSGEHMEWNIREHGTRETAPSPCHRERSKSATFIQTLPKKRACIRRYSPDLQNNTHVSFHTENSHAIHEHSQQWNTDSLNYTKQSSPEVTPHNFIKPSSSTKVLRSTSAATSDEKASAGKSSICDVSALKADMIREIDNEKDDEEDITTFRKRLYESFRNIRERIKAMHKEKQTEPEAETEEVKKTPVEENAMTSLDYMISKTLMQSEDKPFKPRNNHIHEIIRGEKSGKLCLMDLVELQVEIGLA